MKISEIRLKNWKNFREASALNLPDVVYVLGANASGKSNLLDAVRFLRDVSKSRGGGLQQAIEAREGMSKIRCVHARRDTEVVVGVTISDHDDNEIWRYTLGFNIPPSGVREPQVTREVVEKRGEEGNWKKIIDRPDTRDKADQFLMRETSLEQASANADFRDLAQILGSITYVHLVPQLLKFGDQIGGHTISDDPFGQEFLLRIARTPGRTRDARLRRVEKALRTIVPQLENLQFIKDELTGKPHIEMRLKHHRPHGAKQREDQFSDGTLRLISLLWLIQERGNAPLLLEEPELSLNEEIVQLLPEAFEGILRAQKSRRQILITTHSQALLSNAGIDRSGLVVVETSDEGSALRTTDELENAALDSGFSPAEVVLPRARRPRKQDSSQISFAFD